MGNGHEMSVSKKEKVMKKIFTGLALLLLMTPCAADQTKLVLKLTGIFHTVCPVMYGCELLVAGGDGTVIVASGLKKTRIKLSPVQIAGLIDKVRAVNWGTLPGKVGKNFSRQDLNGKLLVEYAVGKSTISRKITITIGKIDDPALLALLQAMMVILGPGDRLPSLRDPG